MRQAATIIVLLGIGIWLAGCAGSISSIERLMPSEQTHLSVILLGNDPVAVEAATTWLERRRFPVVDETVLRRLMSASQAGPREEFTPLREAALAAHAGTLVYVKTLVKPISVKRPVFEEGIARPAALSTFYSVQVAVQGIDADTGTPVWAATAKSIYPVLESERAVIELTQEALADALRHASDAWQPVPESSAALLLQRS